MPFNYERAKFLMEMHGINQVGLEKLTGIPQSLLSKYLRGSVKNISPDNLTKIAAALKTEHGDLLMQKQTPSPYRDHTPHSLYKDGEPIKPSEFFADFKPVIEKNIPYEKVAKGPKRSVFRKIFDEMEVGDSFLFKGDIREAKKFKQGMRGVAAYTKFGVAFVQLETAGHWRCWKLKGKQNVVRKPNSF